MLAVIGILAFVKRRRRRATPIPVLSSPTYFISTASDFVDAGPLPIVTPFDPNSLEATQDPGILTGQQLLVTEDPEAEIVALHPQSSTPPTVLPRSQPVALIPAGVTSKEIARFHGEALGSQHPHDRSTSNESRSASSPNTVTESPSEATSTSNTRRLHTEVESLVRREMERLRTEGLVLEAPPGYTSTEGDR